MLVTTGFLAIRWESQNKYFTPVFLMLFVCLSTQIVKTENNKTENSDGHLHSIYYCIQTHDHCLWRRWKALKMLLPKQKNEHLKRVSTWVKHPMRWKKFGLPKNIKWVINFLTLYHFYLDFNNTFAKLNWK